MPDLVIRPLGVGEDALFDSLPDPGLVGFAAFGDTYASMAAAGEYRPDWSWVALREGVVVARAAWWGGPQDTEPKVLDWFDFTDAEAAVRLLAEAPLRTQYTLKLPPGWRHDPQVKREADVRVAAARAAGLRPLVERYRYRWTPECGVPRRPGRLGFRPEPDDSVFFELFRRINTGSLDAHVRKTIEESGLEASVQQEMDYLLWMPSPREWWRVAFAGDEPVGVSVPSRNYGDPLIGYIGVVPEHRGNGYAYDLLVEATHLLAAEGVDRIVAGTDVTNTPMAATFARAGYPV
ncbi:GNAT family N-acetyltransferase, partial [Nocardiopsis ansamitocini]|uniref:GNAT family N-acetyltransferase n=1 Tax=Nocardiopsis ansamitocini TaxID=1670832 RepID=UPI002554B914